jgi:hypothetical protein
MQGVAAHPRHVPMTRETPLAVGGGSD